MRFRVDVETGSAERALQRMQNGVDPAEKLLAAEAMKDTDQFVPMKTGKLSGGARVAGSSIVYPGPYARYLYHGKLMLSETGSAWAKAGTSKHLSGKSLVFSRAKHGQAQREWFEASKAVNLQKWENTFAKAVFKNGK